MSICSCVVSSAAELLIHFSLMSATSHYVTLHTHQHTPTPLISSDQQCEASRREFLPLVPCSANSCATHPQSYISAHAHPLPLGLRRALRCARQPCSSGVYILFHPSICQLAKYVCVLHSTSSDVSRLVCHGVGWNKADMAVLSFLLLRLDT